MREEGSEEMASCGGDVACEERRDHEIRAGNRRGGVGGLWCRLLSGRTGLPG